MRFKLRMTAKQHKLLKQHLFPGDGSEAVALLLCGRRAGHSTHVLLVHEILFVPHNTCVRTPRSVTWPTTYLADVLDKIADNDLALVKIHSHPEGYAQFSPFDDASDKEVFDFLFGLANPATYHASLIMLPDGSMVGRVVVGPVTDFRSLESIQIVGEDLTIFSSGRGTSVQGFTQRHGQLFGEGTLAHLQNLSVAVVGCSGTGSVVIEMLARLGVKKLVLVDPDVVEEKNLNRILNATREDAVFQRPKVEVLGAAIIKMGLGTDVQMIQEKLGNRTAVEAVAECDVVFGCMDGAVGRSLLNRLATFYLLPYFDIGVHLSADGVGGISEASASVHYILPDGSTLEERGAFTQGHLRAQSLFEADPDAYHSQRREGYIQGVPEDSPAVISINMQIASMAINEFLARLHPYRYDSNHAFSTVRIAFIHGEHYTEKAKPRQENITNLGRGDIEPPLDMSGLS